LSHSLAPFALDLLPVVTDSHLPNTAALVAFSSQAVVTKNIEERKGFCIDRPFHSTNISNSVEKPILLN
jgi:hypothetical protein